MESPFTSPFMYELSSVDDIDELYSELTFAHPKIVVTPDGASWEVWVDTEDETMKLHRLRGQNGCVQIEAESHAHAYSFLEGGVVGFTLETVD